MMIQTCFLCVVAFGLVSGAPRGNLDLGLDDLGAQIQHEVEMSLRPVRAMEMKFKMEGGVGGVTVVTYSPGGRQFVVKNNVQYDCSGTISDSGECSGNLEEFSGGQREDFCFVKSYSQINDQLCLSFGPYSSSYVNGQFKCESLDKNLPTLSISVRDYNELCGGIARQIKYRYIANPDDPQHVEIPNSNPFVKCTNNEPGVCEFSEEKKFSNFGTSVTFNSNSGSTQFSSGPGTVQISNGPGSFQSSQNGVFQFSGSGGNIQVNTGAGSVQTVNSDGIFTQYGGGVDNEARPAPKEPESNYEGSPEVY